jgi:hypothetical protein
MAFSRNPQSATVGARALGNIDSIDRRQPGKLASVAFPLSGTMDTNSDISPPSEHRDAPWGRWLHAALERYRVPRSLAGRRAREEKIPRRLFPKADLHVAALLFRPNSPDANNPADH